MKLVDEVNIRKLQAQKVIKFIENKTEEDFDKFIYRKNS